MEIRLPYGRETATANAPRENLIGVYSPKTVATVDSVSSETVRALMNPIGTRPLSQLVRGAGKVVIVADDITRLTPTAEIIPVILDQMNAGGVDDSRISLVIALGTHRPMTDMEILQKFGETVVRRIRITNHSPADPSTLVNLGATPSGTRVVVNQEVLRADFKLGVGSIVPHHIPGFSGGAKIVQPGVSGELSTADTHLLSVKASRSYLGTEDNPVRRELNRIARGIGLNTILNTVLDREGRVVGAFFGDIEAAFAEGVRLCREVYTVQIPEEADIVISSSHPCDIEFWQAHKTLYPSDLAVKPGGTIIIVSPCSEGIAVTHPEMLDLTTLPLPILRQRAELGEIEDGVAAALAIAWAQVKERESVSIVSGGIDPEEAAKLGFAHFRDLQSALDSALAKHGPRAQITILTHAPEMLPIIVR